MITIAKQAATVMNIFAYLHFQTGTNAMIHSSVIQVAVIITNAITNAKLGKSVSLMLPVNHKIVIRNQSNAFLQHLLNLSLYLQRHQRQLNKILLLLFRGIGY